MTTIINWLTAALAAITIAASINIDGPSDTQAEWDQSEALKELQASQAGTARREVAAQALCNQERGPNSEARWTPQGDLVCTTRRGMVSVASAKVQP
jgi:hypothetical protein